MPCARYVVSVYCMSYHSNDGSCLGHGNDESEYHVLGSGTPSLQV